MKGILHILVLILCCNCLIGQDAQDPYRLKLKQTEYKPLENGLTGLEHVKRSSDKIDENLICIQFYDLPDEKMKKALASSGLNLISYIGGRTYFVEFAQMKSDGLMSIEPFVRSTFSIAADQKLSLALIDRVPVSDEPVRVYILPDLPEADRLSMIAQFGLEITSDMWSDHGVYDIKGKQSDYYQILQSPAVLYLDEIPVDQELRYQSVHLQRSNVLSYGMGRNLHGAGVVIGVGDGGKVGFHEDLQDRVTNFASFGDSHHATHVAGIIGGYPNLRPRYGAGIATQSSIITNNYSDILAFTPDYIEDYGMVVTNNSYGSNLGNCVLIGDYNVSSVILDQQMIDHPELLHVFSAGNDGNKSCSPYPVQYATIAGGYQVAKNVLTVGSTTNRDLISSFSSSGPVHDGRLKPEIVAQGTGVESTRPNNAFGGGSGTSYSGPGVTGIAALLYERYRQLYGMSNPAGALIKALLINTADDFGQPGPDYLFGFGRVNGKRAVECMENAHFYLDTITHGQAHTQQISIPTGTRQVKIMLLWNDIPAMPFVQEALVNDLDLRVSDPTSQTYDPWVLDPRSEFVSNPATRGEDRSNNYEQVTIDTPASGIYEIEITGFSIPQGPQPYVLVYEIIADGIELTYPLGNERFTASVNEVLRFDVGPTENEFRLDYSIDQGANWIMIEDSIDSNLRWVKWSVPTLENDSVYLRISELNTGFSDQNILPVSVMPIVENLSATNICEGTVEVSWDTVALANGYTIYTIVDGIMKPVQTTMATKDTIYGLDENHTLWWSVAANHSNGKPGVRNQAVSTGPSTGNCLLENDLKLVSINGLNSGRMKTPSELSATEQIEVVIKNQGSSTLTNIPISYAINGGTSVTELIPSISGATSMGYTFSTTVDLSIIDAYEILIWIDLPGDPVRNNDTMMTVVKQLANPSLTLPFEEGFETASLFEQTTSTMGLPGLDFLDFETTNGRLRSFAGSDFLKNGNRALTIDANQYGTPATNECIFTFDLSNYDTTSNDLRLNLSFMHHEILLDDDLMDLIWIRGSEQDVWIEAYDFFDQFVARGVYYDEVLGIELSNLLKNENQNFSTSFQIRIGQEGDRRADEAGSEDGITIDDMELYEVSNDIQIVNLISPRTTDCGLANEQIQIQIRNSSTSTMNDIVVGYELDNQPPILETISTLLAGGVLDYSFSALSDLSAYGEHTLNTWVYEASDNYRLNDSLLDLRIIHFPEINNFPYIESFESNDGGWIATGINSSWERGEPKGAYIQHAADGNQAWVTNLNGNHQADEYSFLYSPCFDLTGLTAPTLSFAHAYFLENNYDYSWVEISTDGGLTWNKLGTSSEGFNWYSDSGADAWDSVDFNWKVATTSLPSGAITCQIRFVMSSDVGLEYEGVGIDDIHVFDKNLIYQGNDTLVSQLVSGSNWTDIQNAGRNVVSIHSDGQDLGNVSVQVYNNQDTIRNTGRAYLLNRSWKIESTVMPATSIGLRLFFSDEEAQDLLDVSDCNGCLSPDDPFQFALLKYDGLNQDGDWFNNQTFQTTEYLPDTLRIVPYDSGYYAEIWVDGFSEFWIVSEPVPGVDSICVTLANDFDDAEEHGITGAVNPYSPVLEMTESSSNQTIGFRFPNVKIPNGSHISSAYLQLTSKASTSGATNWWLRSITGGSISGFNTGNYDISQRHKSSVHVNWDVPDWTISNESNLNQRSPDLRLLVQEVINDEYWSPGSAFGLVIGGSGRRDAHSFESNPELAAKMIITYDTTCTVGTRLYVDQEANGIGNGSSWADAFNTIYEAIVIANTCANVAEIWVKKGTYLTSEFNERDQSFEFISRINIYGGFDGTESTIDDRNLVLNISRLDGNIGHESDSTDNALHLVLVASSGIDTVYMDGFHLVNGWADGEEIFENAGSALYNPGIFYGKNLVFESNYAEGNGGVILSLFPDAKLTLEDCELRLNGVVTPVPILNIFGSEMIIKGSLQIKN